MPAHHAAAMAAQCSEGDIECAPWAECLVEGPLPCSNTVSGNVSLFLVYALLLGIGAKLLSRSSQQILQMTSVDTILGRIAVAIVCPLLSALPDLLLVLASGIAWEAEDIQEQLFVGVGVLTGSTILWLTLGWAVLLYRGRSDLRNGEAMDGTLENKTTLTESGVTTDSSTRICCLWMLASISLYLIMQVGAWLYYAEDAVSRESHERWAVVATLSSCFALYVVHTIFLLFSVRYQHRMLREARRRRRIEEVKQRFIDNLNGVRLEGWVALAEREMPARWEEVEEIRSQEQRLLGSSSDRVSGRDRAARLSQLALMLLGGLVLLGTFSLPMVTTLMRLSGTSSHMRHSQFYIAAFVLPLITDGPEVYEFLRQAKHKKRKAVSLLYSTLFVGVTTRSTLVLGVLCTLVLVQKAVWYFSSSTVVTVAVALFVGSLSALMRTLPTFWAVVVGPVLSLLAVFAIVVLESDFIQFE
eukprot:TRINITY_DN1974_c0_g3_i1.p3 TRINITY_DN1974_c0_g3~~TRINITY_DN1974_c0_g3_i1.p3  ORF type:complete len:471 (+),score=191.36 TRINITY_DN1974_c0_g3_i1:144-1556(+)